MCTIKFLKDNTKFCFPHLYQNQVSQPFWEWKTGALNWISLDTIKAEHIFIGLLAIFITSSMNCLLMSFCLVGLSNFHEIFICNENYWLHCLLILFTWTSHWASVFESARVRWDNGGESRLRTVEHHIDISLMFQKDFFSGVFQITSHTTWTHSGAE